MSRNWLVGLALVAGAAVARAQTGAIAGTVRSTGTPVPSARVLLDSAREVRTDTAGRYRFDGVTPGEHRVQAMVLGAAPVTMYVRVTDGETAALDLTLDQTVILDSVVVEGRSWRTETVKALEDRKRLGLGKFLDSTRIHGFLELTTAVADAGPGLKLNRGQLTMGMYPGCLPEIWIDGADWGADQGVLKTYNPKDVMAIEVYVRNVPTQFRSRKNPCGAVLLWTRRVWPEKQ